MRTVSYPAPKSKANNGGDAIPGRYPELWHGTPLECDKRTKAH